MPHHNLSSLVATGVAIGSAMGLPLTPTQYSTLMDQVIRNVSYNQSLESEWYIKSFQVKFLLIRAHNHNLTDGGQGGVQSTVRGNQSCVAEMVTPQQQQLPHGSVAQTFTPHQSVLTPFPSTSSILVQ